MSLAIFWPWFQIDWNVTGTKQECKENFLLLDRNIHSMMLYRFLPDIFGNQLDSCTSPTPMSSYGHSSFQTFIIAGPSAGTTGTAASTNGNAVGDCLTDSFVALSPGGTASPVICGTNTGQHSKTKHMQQSFDWSWFRCIQALAYQTYEPIALNFTDLAATPITI